MGKRKNIAAGNWKMNKNFQEGVAFAEELAGQVEPSDTLVILGVPFVSLQRVGEAIKDTPNVYLAAQNCHQEDSGAYTGEVSTSMLLSVGCDYVILGHSERREYFGESDELIAAKVKKVIDAGMRPIFCCGEALATREAEEHENWVTRQIETGLFGLSAEDFGKVVIAYEPIWAIGTGVTASPEQAQEIHALIRSLIQDEYSEEIAESTSILYGGSVKPANAEILFSQPDIDGGLVGGASLKTPDFLAIIDGF